MSLRLCIIGNSHIACLKTAWDLMAQDRERLTCTFFGSPGGGMQELQRDGSRLRPASSKLKRDMKFTSGGKDIIRLDDYDAFLLVGLRFFSPVFDRRLSAAVSEAALRESFGGTLARRIAADIRGASSAPIFIGSTPRPLKAGVAAENDRCYMTAAEVSAALTRTFHSEGFRFVPQPAETMRSPWSTKAEFGTDAPRLDHTKAKVDAKFDRDDTGHMNTAYGRIYLEQFFEMLFANGDGKAPAKVRRARGELIPSIRDFLGKLSPRPR